MKYLNELCWKILSYPKEILLTIDEKIGIEVFKLGIVLATVYAVQGMQGLSSIPLLFYFKDILHFNEAQLQYFNAITGIAWLVKPLFGFISDRFPICGYRRKTYIILMALIAASSWWLLALMAHNGYSKYAALVLVFNFSSLGYAFVDVVCDAIMVEKGQALKKESVFVNLQWFALGVAGFIAGILSGRFQTAIAAGAFQLSSVFILTGFIPCITAAISWFFIKEEKIKKPNIALLSASAADKPQTVNFGIIKEILSSKVFWLLTAFIFFWKYSPSFSAVFSYYNIDILKFDPKFLGDITAISNAIFPLSIILYAALLKWFPQIKTKHYLYASILVGLVYYAIDWLYLVPAQTFNWFKFYLPFGANVLSCWIIPSLIFLLIILFATRLIKRKISGNPLFSQSAKEQKTQILSKIKFIVMWIIILPLSLIISLYFTGAAFNPFILSYRSLAIVNTVIFGYATIASFLIPLALAAKLAPKKAEGMTYAYFMALSNISAGFLPDLSGAWMFNILKAMLHRPETAASLEISSFFIILLCAALILVALFAVKKLISNKKWVFLAFFTMAAATILYFLGPIFLFNLKIAAVWLVQQSYLALKPIIGNADFLGKEAYRALILRYALIIGAIFTLISAIFVYLLPSDKK